MTTLQKLYWYDYSHFDYKVTPPPKMKYSKKAFFKEFVFKKLFGYLGDFWKCTSNRYSVKSDNEKMWVKFWVDHPVFAADAIFAACFVGEYTKKFSLKLCNFSSFHGCLLHFYAPSVLHLTGLIKYN